MTVLYINGIMWENLFLKTGDQVRTMKGGIAFIGTVELGGIRLKNEKFASPNQFCMHIHGHAINAWTACDVKFKEYDAFFPAKQVRDGDRAGAIKRCDDDLDNIFKGLL